MKDMIFSGSLESLAAGVLRGFMWSPETSSYPVLILLDGRKTYSSSMSKVQQCKQKMDMAKKKARENALREKALQSMEVQVSLKKDLFPSSSDESNFAEGWHTESEEELQSDNEIPPRAFKGKGKRGSGSSSSKLKKASKSGMLKSPGDGMKVFSDSEEELDEVSVLDFFLLFLSPLFVLERKLLHCAHSLEKKVLLLESGR
jgi:hypothetical protein